jgi:hypothetical protein
MKEGVAGFRPAGAAVWALNWALNSEADNRNKRGALR